MPTIEVQQASPEPTSTPQTPNKLADLSRNASVISSSSSSNSSLLLNTPRPRPIRTFSAPRSRSRESPATPRSSKPPSYLTKELGYADGDRSYNNIYNSSPATLKIRAQSRSKSRGPKSRASSVGYHVQANDFEFGEVLGEGSYSTVMHAIYIANGQEYAIKVLDKGHLKRNNKLQTALTEKNTLVRLGSGHPGIVRLHFAFHDEWSLYFVLDLAKNGELQSKISNLGSLSLECSKYYAAQIVDAVAYMHSKDVIHRDLKPENLLLDDAWRLKIADFGTGKILDSTIVEERTGTFVGTAQYVSPELLATNTTYKSSDLWAVGCIIFQMIAGAFPFHGLSEYLTWQKIKNLEYTFPDGFDEEAKDLVQKLLVLDPTQRLGAGEPGTPNDMAALRAHPFFKSIDWSKLWTDPAPPLEPGLVKRDVSGDQRKLEEMGNTWDSIVDEFGSGDDNDESTEFGDEQVHVLGEDGQYHPRYRKYPDYPPHYLPPEVGMPMEIGPMDDPSLGHHEADERSRIGGDEGALKLGLEPLPFPVEGPQTSQGSGKTESNASSSDYETHVDRMHAAVDVMDMSRGRDQAPQPIQLTLAESPWTRMLLPGEELLYHSAVQVDQRSRRLLPKSVTSNIPVKKRNLILTNKRLICVKAKVGRPLVVKNETFFRRYPDQKLNAPREKERESVLGVTSLGSNGFAISTTGKPQLYQATDAQAASKWIEQIQHALEMQEPELSPERR